MADTATPGGGRVALSRKNVLEHFPCFGHFDTANCANMGFLQPTRNEHGVLGCSHCPLEKLCKQESLKYAQNMDVYNSGQIDRPREIIRRLSK